LQRPPCLLPFTVTAIVGSVCCCTVYVPLLYPPVALLARAPLIPLAALCSGKAATVLLNSPN
jgi:hypothetical protein